MARIELRCTDAYLEELKHYVKGRGSDVSKYIKAAVYEKRVNDLKKVDERKKD